MPRIDPIPEVPDPVELHTEGEEEKLSSWAVIVIVLGCAALSLGFAVMVAIATTQTGQTPP